MAARRAELSETEQEVLKALWEAGRSTVRELHERLAGSGHRWAYTTVLTFLTRLEAKGYVTSDKRGAAHVFQPVIDRETLLRERLRALSEDLCGGAATPLLQALVEGHRFSAQEIGRFRELLDRLARESEPPRKGRGGRKR